MKRKRLGIEIERSISSGSQVKLPAHRIDTDETGPCTIHHGHFILVAEALTSAGSRIGLTVGSRGCPCGCRADGLDIMYTPEPAHARAIADQLVSLADQIEADAATQASAAIAKARGR